jgi:hypothetical protein
MDIGIATTTNVIMANTGQYFMQIAPLLIAISAIVIAFGILDRVFGIVKNTDDTV